MRVEIGDDQRGQVGTGDDRVAALMLRQDDLRAMVVGMPSGPDAARSITP